MYKAISLLSQSVDSNKQTTVKLVLYTIDEQFAVPFLKFHLVRDMDASFEGVDISSLAEQMNSIHELEHLTFPSFSCIPSAVPLFTLYCQGIAESLFEDSSNITRIEPSGHYYLEDENICYSFFRITEKSTESEYLQRDTFVWTALIDEILNTFKVCNIPIHSSVTNFFANSGNEFVYLWNCHEDEEGTIGIETIYEYPTVVYSTVPLKKLEFSAMFGIPKNETQLTYNAQLYNYALESYWKELEEKGELGDTIKSGGLLRCVAYLGSIAFDEEAFKTNETINSYYTNNTYYMKTHQQHKPLSHHLVNNYRNYNIK